MSVRERQQQAISSGRQKDASLRIAMLSQPRDRIGRNNVSGSVAIVLENLANELRDRCELMAVAARQGKEAGCEQTDRGLEVYRVRTGHRQVEKALELLDPRPRPRILSCAYYQGYFERAAARLADLAPDIVHVMTFAQAGAVLRRHLPKVPLVLHVHDAMLTQIDPRLASAKLEPFAAVVTCSAWLAEALREHVPEAATRIHWVGNGVDLEHFRPAAGQPPRPASTLLMVGRISPEKGPYVLIEAFRRLAPRYPELKLIMAGTPGLLPYGQARLARDDSVAMADAVRRFYGGYMRSLSVQTLQPGKRYVQEICRQLPPEVRTRIVFTGGQTHDQLPAIFGAADILIQPSVWREPFGLPVAQALAMGVPVIASADGGPAELVQHGKTGLLVPPGDVDALASAIAALLDDREKLHLMGLAARRMAIGTLGWRHAADRMMQVYLSVIGRLAPALHEGSERPDTCDAVAHGEQQGVCDAAHSAAYRLSHATERFG